MARRAYHASSRDGIYFMAMPLSPFHPLIEGLTGALPDETRVVYVSPLKALSADAHRNLASRAA